MAAPRLGYERVGTPHMRIKRDSRTAVFLANALKRDFGGAQWYCN